MKSCHFFVALGLAMATILPESTALAVIVLEQTFEEALPGSAMNGPGSYVVVNDPSPGWQIQGGTDGAGSVTLTAGVDGNGVGGSQALFGSWDTTSAAIYTYNQYTIYGVPGPGTVVGLPVPLNEVEVSMDIYVEGYESEAEMQIAYQSNGVPFGESVYTTPLTNNAFTHVVFTLDETNNPAALDTFASFNLRVQHGAEGFGFDAGNVLRIDNVLVQTIEFVAVEGDYNGNGTVDAADYALWRDLLNQSGAGLAADGNGDEVVNQLDYDYWRTRFGNTSNGDSAFNTGVATPEPTSLSLLVLSAVALAWRVPWLRSRR